MDNAVALVQAYLRVNGYFTVAEYPVVEAMRNGGYREATDLDILAFRFPGAGQLVPGAGHSARQDSLAYVLDPALAVDHSAADMLIGEVKGGVAELNQAATDPAVLRAAFTRFGCCPPDHVDHLVDSLMRDGRTKTPTGHTIRLIAFGSALPGGSHRYTVIALGHVIQFLRDYLCDNWDVLHHADFKDRAFGFLMTLEKAKRGLSVKQARHLTPGVHV